MQITRKSAHILIIKIYNWIFTFSLVILGKSQLIALLHWLVKTYTDLRLISGLNQFSLGAYQEPWWYEESLGQLGCYPVWLLKSSQSLTDKYSSRRTLGTQNFSSWERGKKPKCRRPWLALAKQQHRRQQKSKALVNKSSLGEQTTFYVIASNNYHPIEWNLCSHVIYFSYKSGYPSSIVQSRVLWNSLNFLNTDVLDSVSLRHPTVTPIHF